MFVFSTSITACPDTSGKLGDIRDRHYIVSVYKVSVWLRMLEFEACEVFKIRSLLLQMTGFKDKRNEEIGHYGQTLHSPGRGPVSYPQTFPAAI